MRVWVDLSHVVPVRTGFRNTRVCTVPVVEFYGGSHIWKAIIIAMQRIMKIYYDGDDNDQLTIIKRMNVRHTLFRYGWTSHNMPLFNNHYYR